MSENHDNSKGKAFSNQDMAGPHTKRDDIKFKVPLPSKNAPVYFGGTKYEEEHKDGFSDEDHKRALEQALRDFDPASVGEGRVQDWKNGVPDRNRQGFEDELTDISSSSPISDRTYGDPNRNKGKIK